MAPPSVRCLLFVLSFSVFLLVSGSTGRQPQPQPRPRPQPTSKPNRLILRTAKDPATNLHILSIPKSRQTLLHFVVDLNGKFLWMTCERNQLSASYQAPTCHSTQCSRAGDHFCKTCSSRYPRPTCHNNACGVTAVDPVSHQTFTGELGQDSLSIMSTTGSRPGPIVTVPQFLFACAPSKVLQKRMPTDIHGVAGLGHNPISLPYQLASYFGFRPNFALCLSSSSGTAGGSIFFGEGPFYLQPGVDVSRPTGYTQLTVGRDGEYYVNLRSIRINRRNVPLEAALLTLDKRSQVGGTMISTTTPYTILQHSIYQSFIKLFSDQLAGVPRVQSKEPFEVCYDSSKIRSTPTGPGVPNIDLVFDDQNVWTIVGANSMVQTRPGVVCLAFVDGGMRPKASIVIGAQQLEDNLLQFDLAGSRLGFSSSLLGRRTNCANFNFNPSDATTTP